MPSTTGHKEVPIKVNAWVDKNVALLVQALNLFLNIETLDSCEGNESEGASVYFRFCGGSSEPRPRETCEFVMWLSTALRSQPNPCSDYRLRLEWMASEEPMAEIITYRDNVDNLASKLKLLANNFTLQTLQNFLFAHDNAGKEPRNLTLCRDHQLQQK